MPKSRRPSRAARVLVPGAVAAVLLTGCAQGSGGTASATGAATPAGASPTAGPAGPGSPVPVTPGPDGAVAPGTLLVTDFGSDTVTFVDPARGATGSVKVGTAPYGLAVGEDGRAWVATAEGVAVVDTASRERLALIPYRTDTGPVTTGEYRGGGMGIALAPDGRRVYVGVNVPGGNGTLEVVDTAALKVTDTVPVGRRPFDVDVSRDGAEVYVTNHDSFDVTVVTARTAAPRRIQVAPYGTEGGLGSWLKPHYTAVRPSDGKLLLPFEGERLAVVDPGTGRTTIEPMTANTHQHGATVTADGTLLAVGTGPIDPDVDRGPSLTVRTPGGAERVYPLEGPHESVAVSRDGRTAYVTGGFTRDGYWDGLTVVDLDTGDTRRLLAGSRPLGVALL
ncbi:YncE family protein [Streptomyces sp. TLI_105]|uniref:YncE family protein n=1 Tax=Streptomyces sp. TLI_105 TaxID=1881019 RepID=UPI0008988870|nr:YncE family protein [Streptomyces sp. TLI_105]SED99590.1 40-residue YVTN family beta-propeller repeat-containing protein [Streptomyces sp. TLI_105]